MSREFFKHKTLCMTYMIKKFLYKKIIRLKLRVFIRLV